MPVATPIARIFAAAALLLALFFQFPPAAVAETPFDGKWSGSIEVPGSPLEFTAEFTSNDNDEISGTLSIPVQGLIDIELEGLEHEDDTLRFRLPGIPGEPSFEGVLSDPDTVEGTFSQGGAELAFSMARKDPAEEARAALEGLDTEIEQALEDFNVPGLGIAVVAGGEVVYTRGFGHRDIDEDLPMTPDTLFAIGSTTKAMTNAVLGMLADGGDFDWDEPVRTYLPAFAVEDPAVSNRITARDMVTHRTGMPRHDLLWYNNNDITRAELVDRLEHLELTADLRQRFQYNNLMYLTAGFLTEQLTGTSWEDAVRTRLFEPLGMERTNFVVAESQADPDHARPYRDNDGELEEIPFRSIERIGPAGAVNSSVNEMARWLQFNLDRGRHEGEQLIEASTLTDLHSAQITVPSAGSGGSTVPVGYAMGWFVNVYEGHRMLTHGGGIDGFTTSVMFFPDDDLGVVTFTNTSSSLGNLVARTAVDRVLGIDSDDRIAEARDRRERALSVQDEAEERRDGQRTTGTSPSHAMADYTGVYAHPGYGTLEISAASGDDALELRYNGIDAPFEHWHYDVWSGAETDGDKTFEDFKIAFRSNFDGVVDSLVAPMELTASPIEFEKQPDPKLSDPGFLQRFVGEYTDSVSEQSQRVALAGNELQLILQGQPVYTLHPRVDGRFNIGELQGFAASFDTDDDGNVVSITYYQPNGVFTSERDED